jgi:C4-dicarboxylate-binding protein DctP
MVALALLLALPGTGLTQQKVLKYAHFQPARPDQPKHAAALAFKEHVEKATNGSIKVEIFPAGQFGNDADTMSGLRLGTLDLAVAHDGAIAGIYKPIGVLGIPFLYENHEHAWRVYDSPWLKEFSDDMIKKTGVRLLSLADNGVRHFTNSKRPIRTPDDMKGLKMRVMPSPVFQTLVNSLGASPSAIPWAELPTALQQKVVDGQENGVTRPQACTSTRSTSRWTATSGASTATRSTRSTTRVSRPRSGRRWRRARRRPRPFTAR